MNVLLIEGPQQVLAREDLPGGGVGEYQRVGELLGEVQLVVLGVLESDLYGREQVTVGRYGGGNLPLLSSLHKWSRRRW